MFSSSKKDLYKTIFSVAFMEKLLSHLFFFFFSFQIFSPSINDRTIYLELFVAVLNPYYWKWVSRKLNADMFLTICAFVLLPIVFMNIVISVKILLSAILVGFLFYSWQRKIFYVKFYISISVLFAIAQFITYYTNPTLSHELGPTNLATMVWGDYATATFTNFYSINGYIPRVSGLSREAGFLASYLIAYIMLLYIEVKRNGLFISKKVKFFLCAGFIVSLSKMSLIIVPLILLEKINLQFRRIVHPLFALTVFFVCMLILWHHNYYIADEINTTFFHRFGAYALIPDVADVKTILFGEPNLHNIDFVSSYASKVRLLMLNYDEFAGLGGTVLSCGILLTLFVFLLLIYIGVSSTGIIQLLLLTLATSIFTNQNFVILAYFIVFKYYCRRNSLLTKPIIHKPT